MSFGSLKKVKDGSDSPLNSYFDENGFQSKSLIKNLGSTFIYVALYLIGYIVLIFVSYIHKFTEKLSKF